MVHPSPHSSRLPTPFFHPSRFSHPVFAWPATPCHQRRSHRLCHSSASSLPLDATLLCLPSLAPNPPPSSPSLLLAPFQSLSPSSILGCLFVRPPHLLVSPSAPAGVSVSSVSPLLASSRLDASLLSHLLQAGFCLPVAVPDLALCSFLVASLGVLGHPAPVLLLLLPLP